MLIASLATTGTDHGGIGAALMGEKTPEDWGFLKAGGDTLYATLEFIPPNTAPTCWSRSAGRAGPTAREPRPASS